MSLLCRRSSAPRWIAGIELSVAFSVALGGAALSGATSARAEDTIDPQAARPAPGSDERRAKPAAKTEARAVARPGAVAAVAAPGAEDSLLLELRAKGQKDEPAIALVQKLGALDTPRSTEILLGELSLGMTPKVSGAVLDVLAARRSAESLPLLSLYARHRNPELRKRAVSALAALVLPPKAPEVKEGAAAAKPADKAKKPAAPAAPALTPAQQATVVPLLISALSDANADVRGVAAEALGARREKAAEPALIKLLLRKDPVAPAALGQIGGAETARSLAEMIGNVPDRLLGETLGMLLIRPDFGPDPLRLEVVKTLGKLSGSQPIDLLNDYVQATAKDKADKVRPSRVEAQKIIEQRTAK
jgi:HEAT repeat protein